MPTLADNNYRIRQDTPCCRQCRHGRPADMTWATLYCRLTVNQANVSDIGICDKYEARED